MNLNCYAKHLFLLHRNLNGRVSVFNSHSIQSSDFLLRCKHHDSIPCCIGTWRVVVSGFQITHYLLQFTCILTIIIWIFRIRFNVVSEPPEDDQEGDCEDVGVAFVSVKRILESKKDVVDQNIDCKWLYNQPLIKYCKSL